MSAECILECVCMMCRVRAYVCPYMCRVCVSVACMRVICERVFERMRMREGMYI